MSKWDRWPWRKLYVPEEGSFALLPLYVRALAGQLLKLSDEQGRIFIGKREPWEAIARRAGADRGDRRLLKVHIPVLIADGYLTVRGEYLVIHNQRIAQASKEDRQRFESEQRDDREPTATEPQTDNEAATTEQRSGTNMQRPSNETERSVNDGATTEQRTVHDRATKSELSDENPSSHLARRDKIRREEKEPPFPLPSNDGASARPDPFMASLRNAAPDQRTDVRDLFAAWAQTFGYTGAKLRKPYDERARVLAGAIDTYGTDTCVLVLANAPADRMVSGKDDEKGRAHDSIDYIFGNENAFQRILKAANEAKRRTSGGSIRDALQAARATGGAS